jgi:hypothetical protein
MASRKKKQEQAKRNWITAIIVSIVLLVAFLALQSFDAKMLQLEVKWLVVASIPLIIAILRSNLIRKFKGFGFELETRLQEPVGRINLLAVNALMDLPGDEKQSRVYLEHLSNTKRMQIQRLTLREGRREYYRVPVLYEYILQLPNLKYFEVLSNEGNFVALIPVELFGLEGFIDEQKLHKFVELLANNEIANFLHHSIIRDTISENENLIDALPIVRKSKYGLLPVISHNGNMLGVITTELIERKIADEVLATQESE